jgi:hypothetical protein
MMMREICRYLWQYYNSALFSMLTSKVKGSRAPTALATKRCIAMLALTKIIGNRKLADLYACSEQLLCLSY